MSDMIPLERVRWQLGTVWFSGAGLVFTVLIVQSLAGVHEDHVQAVWGWLLPNIAPTLSLMIGVFAAAALRDQVETDAMKVRKPFARLALALSLFHLLAVAATIATQPFAGTIAGAPAEPMALFEMSNLWLGPLQGLVAAAIGALFFSKSDRKAGGAGRARPRSGRA
jgi:hypothetical protein